MGNPIWPAGQPMTVGDALLVSLSGLSTVFAALIFLALIIVLVSKLIKGMGLDKDNNKPAANAKRSASKAGNTKAKPVKAKPEEDSEEIAVILSAVSAHTRVPVEYLKINSITKK